MATLVVLGLLACDDAESSPDQQLIDVGPDEALDAGPSDGSGPDAPADLGRDAASPDQGPDAQLDAAPDAVLDALLDGAVPDSTPDRGPDAADAGVDVLPDVTLDMAEDAAPDVMDGAVDAVLDGAVDAAPDQQVDAGPDRCLRWDDLPDDQLVTEIHAELEASYQAIEPAPDLGGNLNRYTTARHFMFTQVERFESLAGVGVECVYTGRFVATDPDEEPDHGDMNAEHVWPRSRMDDNRESARYAHEQSDIHNLWPADSGANSTRGSLRFGEPVRDRNLDHLPAVEGENAQGERVWSPREGRRGDLARTVLYFSLRWGRAVQGTEEEVLRRWAEADPVDGRERARNDAIEAIQGNRNPLIDCPQLLPRLPPFADFPIADRDLALP